jgi:hypothetical protein
MRRDRQTREQVTKLVEVVPSRWDDEPVARAQAMIAALASVRGVALEWAAAADRVRFFARAQDDATLTRVLAHLRSEYPQSEVRAAPSKVATGAGSDGDLLGVRADEYAVAYELRLMRTSLLPLRSAETASGPASGRRTPHTYRADPLAGVMAQATSAAPDTRVTVQCVLDRASSRWQRRLAVAAAPPAHTLPAPKAPASSTAATFDILPFLLLGGLGAVGLRGYLWYRDGQLLPVVALSVGMVLALALAAALVTRLGRPGPSPSEPLKEKLAGSPWCTVHLRVIAIAPDRRTAAALARRVAEAYQVFDHPQGNGLRPHRWRGDTTRLRVPRGLLRRPDVLSAAELAGLWHLPAAGMASAALAPVRARRLLPPSDAFSQGSRLGIARHQQAERPVHLPPALLHRHHLIVAKTRRGKSTLLLHLARSAMTRLASDEERVALVVIDPHQDLAEAVLSTVPAGLDDRVVYLNLAERDRPAGVNLLDPQLFPDRDRTAEQLVTMLHLLWPDNWGPRMEGALRAALLALHEANQSRPPAGRYTLLDVGPFLSNHRFRSEVLGQVADRALHAWWAETYTSLHHTLQQQIATPVTTKIGRFLVHETSRLTVGQARSTFDPRALLREGGVLVVNAAVGSLGEGGAALLGATVLNLLARVVEEQVQLPPSQRTRVVALVDESSVLAAADYPRMLSELGKDGLSVVLVTQSLARLDAIDRHLRSTILANIDALTVFQVSADDARVLTPELGPELAPEDLTDLPDYTCYARWAVGGERPAAFSFTVDQPPPFDSERVAALARRSAQRVGRPRAEVLAEVEETLWLRRASASELVRMNRDADDLRADGEDETSEVRGTDQADPTAVVRRNRNHARSNAARRKRED